MIKPGPDLSQFDSGFYALNPNFIPLLISYKLVHVIKCGGGQEEGVSKFKKKGLVKAGVTRDGLMRR